MPSMGRGTASYLGNKKMKKVVESLERDYTDTFFLGETRFKLSSCFWLFHSIYNIYNYLHHYMPTVQLRI